MRPPACLAVLLLAACDLGPLPDDTAPGPGPGTTIRCERHGWVPASTAEVYLTQLVVDGLGLLGGVDPEASYDGVASVCVEPTGGGVEFVFEVVDEPYGRILMTPNRTGSLDPGPDGLLEVELFAADPPVTFRSEHWVFGGWDVSELNPFEAMLTDMQAQLDGRFLTLSLTASIAP